MKAQLIYSVAALATFPIVVNAQVNADNIGKITAKKDGTAWTKNIELAPGKYTFKSAISTGTAGKKATVSILNGSTTIVDDFDVTVGAAISKDFTLDATTTVTIKVVSEVASADFIADESVVQLNFNFSKVAELLQIEYNKVTQVLAEAQYDGKATDAQTHSALYDRIVSIANADYAFYKANTEGLQAIYNDQTQVSSGFTLYDNIADALNDVKTKEVAYLDGSNGLGGLDTRYNSLNDDFDISYVTTALTASKTAAKSARDAFNSEPTAENLKDAKAKIEAYKKAIENEEGVKTDNEDANNYLKAELGKVNGDPTSYYATSLAQIATQYADPNSRYADLKGQVETALAAIVTGTGNFYDPVVTAINTQYTAKKSKEKKNDLINEIAAFKEKLTRVVSDYSTVRGQLAAVYAQYDAEETAANNLTKDADDFLTTFKNDVNSALNTFKSFIEANDQFTTVANLTEDAVNAKIADITTAKNNYTAKKVIFDDWKALQNEVNGQTTSLNTEKGAIDTYAKDTKHVDDAVFKPTTIWANTISAIEGQISTLLGNVNANKTDATNYKNNNAYKNALAAIKTAIANLKTNANAATDIFATVDGKIKAAQTLRAALLDPAVEPMVDLTTLNVWDNQVTIDDAVKARTPYKKFINSTDGTITDAISTMESALAAAPGKTAMLNAQGTNVDNVLGYLKSIAPVPADVLKDELATMEAIKANYTADNEKFDQQIVQQQCEGIITMINDKAVVFATSIKALQDKIDATTPTMSNANKAKLQTEINAITAKIDAAKAVAAKAGATKDELTAAYNSIKDLATTDIATAQANLSNYKSSFTTSTGFYDTLKGGTTDPSTASTLNGLTKKVTEQKVAIDALAKLTDTQKNTLKGKVDAVEVVKQEGTPAVDVTYTLTKIQNDIETAWQNETLDAIEVTRYQGIIDNLKDKTDDVKTQADRLNNLEDQLSQINFTTAANNIKAKDPNENGFYLKKLLGNAAAGECTFDFNALKNTIEADDDITAAEVTTYSGQITALNGTITDPVTGLAALAETNLNAWKDVKDAYSKDAVPSNPAIWGNGGAVQQYDAAMAKLEADFATSKLEDQKMALATLKEALDASKNTAEANYNAGTATAADKTDLLSKLDAIKNQWEEYTNEVNYNGQIAADNKAIWEAANAAHADADAQYAISSSIINTYKLFKSNELKAATEKAQTELQDLLTYLEGYDAKVAEIQGRVDDTYGKIVSPAKFDTEETFKAEFEAVKAELKTKTQTLSDKIKEYASEPVNASATTYTNAIAASKAKVVKFSATDADVPAATVDGWFTAIDGLLTAINNVKDDDTKIKDLDTALKNASDSGSGILAKITNVEQTKAAAALNTIKGTISTTYYYSDWSSQDRNDYEEVVYYSDAQDKVDNFATYKANLQRIKANADQIALDKAAIAAATTAISNANTALTQLISDYQQFAAGAQVKAAIDQIAADLEAHPAGSVTVANSGEWKTFAEGVYTAATATTAESGRIINVYNDLFDAEVTVIEGLIAQAKEENLTYSYDGTNPSLTKEYISGEITAQEGYLTAAKEAVAKPDTDPAHKTKKNALLIDLSGIEAVLNADLLTMTTGNETNVNDVIMGNLTNQRNGLQTRLNNSFNELNGNYYQDVSGYWHSYNVPTALSTTKSQIQTTITELNTYLTTHAGEIVAYQANARAMMTDIDAAITKLYSDVSAEKAAQDNANEITGAGIINGLWTSIQNSINTANSKIAYLENQLSLYGSASNYTNKVNKLKGQTTTAQSELDNAKTEAEGKTTMQEKYTVAKYTAEPNVNNALTGVAGNCNDIESLAKQAYIDAFIAKLNAQMIADSWTASSNYTTTDKGRLSTMLTSLQTYVTTLKSNAEGQGQAEILYHPTWGYETSAGVIATLERGEGKFNDDLAELKQALKDMSLVEDVKGHVSGNDEISTDDLEDLADIILNAEEESADLSRCDISGDGTVDVTDLVWLRYFLVHDEWPNVAAAARGNMASANDYINMEVVSVENNVTRIAINLDNETVFNHFQLNVQLPEGAKVVSQTLGERVEGANLMMAQNGTTVRMLAISTANNVFAGNEGAVVYLNIEGLNGEVNIEKAIFTDTELNGHQLTANSTTSIRESITNALQSAGQKIYNMGGKMMNGLKKGVNIIRNADGSAKKVMK